MYRLCLFFFLAIGLAFAGEPVKVCVAQPGGPEAKNWKLQVPVARQIEQEAAAKQLSLSAPLLTTDNEKRSRAEAGEKGCSYILLMTLDATRDQVVGTLNPNPTAKPQADVTRAVNATPTGLDLKYKLITPDGRKTAAATIPMTIKQNATASDFEEAGHKLISTVATQVLEAVTRK